MPQWRGKGRGRNGIRTVRGKARWKDGVTDRISEAAPGHALRLINDVATVAAASRGGNVLLHRVATPAYARRRGAARQTP